MKMHYASAIIGPTETGKTETVKNLGNIVGIFVIVYNWQKQYGYKE